MSVFGDMEDNAPDGSMFIGPETAWTANSGDESTQSSSPAAIAGAGSGSVATTVPDGNGWSPMPSLDSTIEDNVLNLATPGVNPTQESADPLQQKPQETKKRKRRLIVTVTRIELTKAEPIVWFDVAASLPRFRPSYRDVRRTHRELVRFADHLASANPECFVPALPGPTNSYKPDQPEFTEKLQQDIQKWFDRVTRSPLLTRDDEFLYFTEATTGYVPVVKVKPPATGLARKMYKQFPPPADEVEELRDFRPQAKLLYQYSDELRQKLDHVSRTRKQLGADFHRLALEVRELHGMPQLSHMWDRVARASAITGDTEFKKVELENVTIGDTMEMVGKEGFVIKETLTNRHFLMRDLIKSQQATHERHQRATRLKGASNISPAKVDEAITQLEAAANLERRITTTVRRVSDNLVAEKHIALDRIEADILEAVGSYALQFIDQDRRVLAAWENTRVDVRAADPHHTGGLSRLGRDTPTSPRRSRHSQNRSRDDWSDREQRAKDFAPRVPEESKAEVLDPKDAVSMLTSTFFAR